MAMGAYLSLRSERDHHMRVRHEEEEEIATMPDIEREEIRVIFEKKGFSGADLDRVVDVITSNKQVWLDTMMTEEHGITEESTERPGLHGIITYLSFLSFGGIPLFPYFFGVPAQSQFLVAIISTFVALGCLGVARSYITKENLFRGPLEIMGGGAICAAFAYGVGAILHQAFGVSL